MSRTCCYQLVVNKSLSLSFTSEQQLFPLKQRNVQGKMETPSDSDLLVDYTSKEKLSVLCFPGPCYGNNPILLVGDIIRLENDQGRKDVTVSDSSFRIVNSHSVAEYYERLRFKIYLTPENSLTLFRLSASAMAANMVLVKVEE